MRTPILLAAVIAVALLTTFARTQDKPDAPKDKADASARKIKELQKERIAALKEVAEQSLKLAQASRLDTREAVDARMALLKAELEVAEKESDRVALYKGALDSLKACEEMAKSRYESGRATSLDLHKARAAYLEVEIELERLKARDAKGRK
jgi:hypothetical protein